MRKIEWIRGLWRELRIRRYKDRKVRVLPDDPVKNYRLYFRLEIKSGDGKTETAEQVFDITIPAQGFYYARQSLERWVHDNLNINVLDFEVVDKSAQEPVAEKLKETT